MRLGRHPALDALCGEYLVGTLRGAARRRFERALAEEPLVAQRLNYWEQTAAVNYSDKVAMQPSPDLWRRVERDLELHRFVPPWYARLGLWRIWAVTATLALVVAVVVPNLHLGAAPPQFATVAVLSGKAPESTVTAELARSSHRLRLHASRPAQASTSQSFELWLLPADGAAPVPLAVIGALDSEIDLGTAQVGRLAAGAKLAISVEPAGGSPTGAPTGPVILVGAITS